jgi:signal peptidase I
MDFALLMLTVLVAAGLIWLLDHFIWLPARRREAEAIAHGGGSQAQVDRALKEPVYVEYARAFFPVILLVFLLRSFVVEPFRIPSGSMLPSLLIGDFILVNKFDYGIRLPVINLKIIDIGEPKRGDVIVFRFPEDPSINYIKRVVGLPGDHIVYRDKRVYVNGLPMKQQDERLYRGPRDGDCAYMAERFSEKLDGARHDILLTPRPDPRTQTFVVPDNHYFVMGDNRDCSNDSRYWGYVPDANLVGKAFLIWFSVDTTNDHKWLWDRIVWQRIGHSIQ